MKKKLLSLVVLVVCMQTITIAQEKQMSITEFSVKYNQVTKDVLQRSIPFKKFTVKANVPNGCITYCNTVCGCYCDGCSCWEATYSYFNNFPIIQSVTASTGCTNACVTTWSGTCNGFERTYTLEERVAYYIYLNPNEGVPDE